MAIKLGAPGTVQPRQINQGVPAQVGGGYPLGAPAQTNISLGAPGVPSYDQTGGLTGLDFGGGSNYNLGYNAYGQPTYGGTPGFQLGGSGSTGYSVGGSSNQSQQQSANQGYGYSLGNSTSNQNSQGTSFSNQDAQGTSFGNQDAQGTSFGKSSSSQSGRTGLVQEAVPYYERLLQLNRDNYGNILNAYSSGQSNLSNSLPGIYQGYQGLMGGVMDTLNNTGQAGYDQINRMLERALGGTMVNAAGSGLANSTRTDAQRMQQGEMAAQQANLLTEQLAKERANAMSQIGLAGQAAQMQGVGMSADMAKALGGTLGSYDFKNTFGNMLGQFSEGQSQSESGSQNTSTGRSGSQNTSTGRSGSQQTSSGSSQSNQESQNMNQGYSQGYSTGQSGQQSQNVSGSGNYSQYPQYGQGVPGTSGGPGGGGYQGGTVYTGSRPQPTVTPVPGGSGPTVSPTPNPYTSPPPGGMSGYTGTGGSGGGGYYMPGPQGGTVGIPYGGGVIGGWLPGSQQNGGMGNLIPPGYQGYTYLGGGGTNYDFGAGGGQPALDGTEWQGEPPGGQVGGNAAPPSSGFGGEVGSGGGQVPSGGQNNYTSPIGTDGKWTMTTSGERILGDGRGGYVTASGRRLTAQELSYYGYA